MTTDILEPQGAGRRSGVTGRRRGRGREKDGRAREGKKQGNKRKKNGTKHTRKREMLWEIFVTDMLLVVKGNGRMM